MKSIFLSMTAFFGYSLKRACGWISRRLFTPHLKFDTKDAFIGILVFFITLLFYLMLGHAAQLSKGKLHEGDWYQPFFAQHALNIYQNGSFSQKVDCPKDSKAWAFVNEGWKSRDGVRSLQPDDVPAQVSPWVSILKGNSGISAVLGYWWRFIGFPSWDYVYYLLAIFGASTTLLSYFLFRCFCGRIWATVLLIPTVFYPLNIEFHLSELRDGSRAIFVIGTLLLLALIVRPGWRWKKIFLLAITGGALLGAGYGFRTDFLLPLAWTVPVVCCCVGGGIKRLWQKKVVFLLVFFAWFVGSSSYIWLNHLDQGHGFPHVMYIGMNQPRDEVNFKISRLYYKWCPIGIDWYGDTSMRAAAWYRNGEICTLHTPAWDKAGQEELVRLVRHFPYDFSTRCLLASKKIMELPSSNYFSARSEMPFKWLCKGVAEFLPKHFSRQFWLIMTVVAVFLVWLSNWRRGLLLTLLILAVSGVYAGQFQTRHYFYLYFIPLLATGFICSLGWRLLGLVLRHPRHILHHIAWKKFLYGAVAFVTFIFLSWGVWAGLALYQSRHLQTMMRQMAGLPATALAYEIKPAPEFENKIWVEVPSLNNEFASQRYPELQTPFVRVGKRAPMVLVEFVKLDLNIGTLPAAGKMNLRVEYDLPGYDRTKPFPAAFPYGFFPALNYTFASDFPVASPGRYSLIVPIYFHEKTHFRGFLLPEDLAKSVEGVVLINSAKDMFYHGYLWVAPEMKNRDLIMASPLSPY